MTLHQWRSKAAVRRIKTRGGMRTKAIGKRPLLALYTERGETIRELAIQLRQANEQIAKVDAVAVAC
jgi:hypothetical protein